MKGVRLSSTDTTRDRCDHLHAGLESSDEEEYQEEGEDAAGDNAEPDAGEGEGRDAGRAAANGSGEAAEMQSPGGRGRLLKRQRAEGSEEQQADGLEDDDLDEAVPGFQVCFQQQLIHHLSYEMANHLIDVLRTWLLLHCQSTRYCLLGAESSSHSKMCELLCCFETG